jgi:hypothetical protein
MLIDMRLNTYKQESYVIMNTQDLKGILDAVIPADNFNIVADTFGNVIKTYKIDDETALSILITSDGTIRSCYFC